MVEMKSARENRGDSVVCECVWYVCDEKWKRGNCGNWSNFREI